MSANEPPVQIKVDWKTVYDEVRRAYEARVGEVAKQQDRLATVLTANGLVFALIGGAIPVFITTPGRHVPSAGLFVAALSVLACGLIAGGVGLWPRIPVRTGDGGMDGPRMEPEDRLFFLDASDVYLMGKSRDTEQFLKWLAEQVQNDAARAKHTSVLRFRRWMIRIQITCILAGAVLLVAALLATLPT